MSKRKINVVTLGCSKNVVDSEYLMRQLEVDGWDVIFDSNDTSARVVVINTCGFIADAQEESIDTILSFVEAKEQGKIDKIFVMGCLSQRFREDLIDEIPEVDGFFGVTDLPEILKSLNTKLSNSHQNQRFITTPNHYAYLKISEGCSWGCSYCAIPLIRGKHVSKPIPDLLEEAQYLVNQGVKELILIAQDSTFYGKDIYGSRKLPELINELSTIDGLEWIRIHYAYPKGFPLELLNVMRSNPKVCKYIDIPFQHISTGVLKAMRRGINRQETIEFIETLRREVPGIAIRTTLLVGHPGETEADFNELLQFVKEMKFDRLGVFAYSEEEGTHSATLADDVPEEVKQSRVEQVMELQQQISLENNRLRLDKVFRVIIDREEEEYYIGRTEFDSPEVDQEVLIPNNQRHILKSGDFIECRIVDVADYDLYGEIIS
ncbi:MAG: 30S ribosomal protein S12 methylthiotransferase RimO [Tenuifilaceae bacterium]|jgi:ribosomal protein S12 methylthiotransferase|nr:30S ribosomal protein S12 methylthiotransferase RimO [Tenuifilaceae bacterium]